MCTIATSATTGTCGPGQGSCPGFQVGTSCTSDMSCGLTDIGGFDICQGPTASSRFCCVGSGYGCADSAVCCSGVCAGPSGNQVCMGELAVTTFSDGGPKCAGSGKACFEDDECCGTPCVGGSCSSGQGNCGAAFPVGHTCTADSDCCSIAVPESAVCEGPPGQKVCCIASGNSCGVSSVCCRGLCNASTNLCE